MSFVLDHLSVIGAIVVMACPHLNRAARSGVGKLEIAANLERAAGQNLEFPQASATCGPLQLQLWGYADLCQDIISIQLALLAGKTDL